MPKLEIEKIKKSTFKYIESEIYSYHDTLKQIESLRYEIIHQSHSSRDQNNEAGKSSVRNISNETERIGTALATDKRIERMHKITKSIKKVYDQLDSDKKRLMKLYYWDRPGELTWDGVARELSAGRMTVIRWRRQIVTAIAYELGER